MLYFALKTLYTSFTQVLYDFTDEFFQSHHLITKKIKK